MQKLMAQLLKLKLDKSTRKYRKKMESKLSRKGILFEHISDYEKVIRLKNSWLDHFAGGIKTGDIYIDEFMWNIFSSKRLPCLEADEATARFVSQNKTGCYILYQFYDDAYYLENAAALIPQDLIEGIDFPGKDLYVVDKEFNWTYIITHESDCGPYFYDKNMGRNE
jgi:hypothetical protein